MAGLLFALTTMAEGAAQQATFRTATRTVPVYATVTDAAGRLVPDLRPQDFEIFDNGRRRDVTLFDAGAQPVSAAVMLDASGSMTLQVDLLRQAAAEFVRRLGPADQARIGSFSGRDRILLRPEALTGNRDQLMDALRGDLQYGNPTALWDAVDRGMDALAEAEGRRVVVVFTDGADTDSRHNRGQVLTRARTGDVMVYAIGLRATARGRGVTAPDPGLQRLAEETGGGYFELQRTDQLDVTFARVVQELHSQYLLGFAPPVLDGSVHTLEVRLNRPGLTARARKSYVAR